MTSQNERPPTNHHQNHIDLKRKNVDTSSNNNNNDNGGKAIRIDPKHEDMVELDLSLWPSSSPSSSPPEPTPSQWQLSLSPPLSSSLEQPSANPPPLPLLPPQPSAHPLLPLPPQPSAHPLPPPPLLPQPSAHPLPPPPLPPQPSSHPLPQQPNPNLSPSPPPTPPGGAGEGDGSSESENDRDSDSETIVPPYEWATNRPAIVHTLDHLLSNQIEKIKGGVKCKRCECEYEMELDLRDKFSQLEELIWENKDGMYERAPEVWKNPTLPRCRYCHQDNSAKPVIGRSKKAINWLFLLLGQLLGCCTLDQLKYFCQHTKNHRTGAKDRLLYLVYLTLCKQLRPNDPNFDR